MPLACPPVEARLDTRLAQLHGASAEAIEAAIALWPLATRLQLAAKGIIDTSPVREHRDSPGFALTDYGIEQVAECARREHEREGS